MSRQEEQGTTPVGEDDRRHGLVGDGRADAIRLQAISGELIRDDDVGSLYQKLVEMAVLVTRADAGSMQMYDPAQGALELLAWTGFSPESAAQWRWIDTSSSTCCAIAMRRGARMMMRDVAADAAPDYAAALGQCGLRAVQSTPLIARDGTLLGMISTHWATIHTPHEQELQTIDVLARQAADLLERTAVERALRDSESRLQLAVDAAGLGTFVWYPDGDRGRPDARMLAMFGLPADGTITLSDAMTRLLHPADRDGYADAVHRALDPAGPGRLEEEVRFLRPDGTEWVAAVVGVVHFEQGLPQHMAGIVADVTARRRAEEQLRASARAAELRERREREFVANAAHELRTPLTAIITAVDALEGGATDVPQQRRCFLDHLRREAERLDRLCNSLLLLAQTQTPEGLPASRVSLRGLLEEIAADVSLQPGVTIRVEAPPRLSVSTNRGLLERIVMNLAENAAKHTREGTIRLSASTQAAFVIIEVRDDGDGFPAEVGERIFDRFYRGEARDGAGFGLGLAIAHQAATAIGAQLSVIPAPPDARGTLARLTLPKSAPTHHRPPKR